MGLFSEVADFFDYMVNGENSESARRMREERERLERTRVIVRNGYPTKQLNHNK